MEPVIEKSELYWREYNLHIELYKFHMDMALKANLFFYAITGGILTYVFQKPELRNVLFLPVLMGLTLCGGFIYAGFLSRKRRRQIFVLAKELALESAPDVNLLQFLLWAFAFLFFVVAAGMTFFIYYPSLRFTR